MKHDWKVPFLTAPPKQQYNSFYATRQYLQCIFIVDVKFVNGDLWT